MKLEIIDSKLVLKSEYDPELVEKIKTIPANRWNKKTRCWEFPPQESVYLQLRSVLGVTNPALEKIISHRGRINLGTYKFRHKPFQHQKEGIAFVLERFGFKVEE